IETGVGNLEFAMFTEGLDPHALRWVREDQSPILTHEHWIDPLRLRSGGGRGLGVPPPERFRSGHLPIGAIPISRTIPIEDYSESGSDMDVSSDTEVEEIRGGKYFVGSSPSNDVSGLRVSDGAFVGNRYAGQLSGRNYYSSNRNSAFSSLRQETVRDNGYMEEEEEIELSDSGGSLEFASQTGKDNGRGSYFHFRKEVSSQAEEVGAGKRGSYPAENYTFSDPFIEETNFPADKCGGASLGKRSRSNSRHVSVQGNPENFAEMDAFCDAPTVSPIHGCDQEVGQAAVQAPAAKSCSTGVDGSGGSNVEKEPSYHANGVTDQPDHSSRSYSIGADVGVSSSLLPARVPTFQASAQGPWHCVISYDACVRLCLHSWARGCMEAPIFLDNECALLRSAFGLQQILLQSEEELLAKRSLELVSTGAAPKPRKTICKLKVQVRKVRMSMDMPSGCSFSQLRPPMLKLEPLRYRLSYLQSTLSSGWESVRKVRVVPRLPANSSFSKNSLAYMHASAKYIKQLSGLLKSRVTTLRNNSSYEIVQGTYSCRLRMKSSDEDSWVRMQPGSGETHVFLPDSLGGDLIIEVYDSNGKSCGLVVAQVASIVDYPGDKLRWWPLYCEPEHELVGRIQLFVNYTASSDENNPKCGSVAETVAYDIVLEAAMKSQNIQERNLVLHGSWKWLLTEFASYYGVSDVYTKLRYLSYVMDVATPTEDCLALIHDLLLPVIVKRRSENTLSHQENRILGEIEEQTKLILAMVFENYKSLDESLPSGMVEAFGPTTGSPSPALAPAVKLYTLLHDILSPEAQLKLCSYFQAAARKRSRRHLHDTDEYIARTAETSIMDDMAISIGYQKMRSLCYNLRNEVFTDIEIHNQDVLPSFVDLPSLAASIYSVELYNRLRAFLVACPPTSPSPPVADLLIATANFQRDLASWNICPVKGGVDAKQLFHLYIILWIQEKRLALLESCKLDKVRWAGVRTQYMTTPFVDDMYGRLSTMLNEYDIIICRWPEYIFVLEIAIADVEKAVVEALEKQYSDVLASLKDTMAIKKFGLKYLGIFLNTMKRLLDVLRPKLEMQLKSWGSCIPDGGNTVAGERLSEVTVIFRAKFRNYMQAVVEKLVENTRAQSATKIKKIIEESKDIMMEADIHSRIQPLRDLLTETITHVHEIFEVHVFVALCRGFWDRMGQDVLSFLENRKENRAWYRGARVTVGVLDDTFASQLQQLLGNALQEKDLEPPRSIKEARSVLCKDAPIENDSAFFC
ncbi:hypothetical protein ACMD2_14233, partial [Ananas comosus]